MPSESANMENASEMLARDPTPRQEAANSAGPSMIAGDVGPQPPQPVDSSYERDVVQEEQGDTTPDLGDPPVQLPLPKINDPLETQFLEPDSDPFDRVLKPMLEKDTVRCNAWKDEVQNILIFAGLFSAVVTAFIIESYQRLQPDPNDAIVSLLAHIAERLDNSSINATASVSSIVADTGFSPSRPDVNINVFWFISLVLSLTAALIGIITLQWLREHQRYNSTLKPRETMAILNARLHSLTRWYVPQIFAGLPLLLQGAIVLFFAGMIEFLFALSLEVAIPVLLTICIPLLFLIATTLLPVLQMCILTDPFRLSINNNVPSPCPYKSPQSLIARRFSTASETAFKYLAFMIAGAYECVIHVICLIRKLRGHHRRLPIFRLRKSNLTLRLGDWFPQSIAQFLPPSNGDWTSIDKIWLQVRTTYTISLQFTHRDDHDLTAARTARIFEVDPLLELPEGLPSDLVDDWRKGGYFWAPSLLPEVLDCTHAIMQVITQNQPGAEIRSAAYHSLTLLCSQPFQRRNFHYALGIIKAKNEQSVDLMVHLTDLCVAFGRFLHHIGHDSDFYDWGGHTPIPALFVQDVINNEPSTTTAAEIISVAFMVSARQAALQDLANIEHEWIMRLVANQLEISPARLFSMRNIESWLPFDVYTDVTVEAQLLGDYSQSISTLFLEFLENCSIMKPSSELVLRPAPVFGMYGGLLAYMRVIVYNQSNRSIADTLAHLAQLCGSTEDIIQKNPFLLMVACFYLRMATYTDHVSSDEPLLKLVFNACRMQNGPSDEIWGWDRLNAAIDTIYHHHNPPPSQTIHSSAPLPNQSQSTAILTNSNGHDNV